MLPVEIENDNSKHEYRVLPQGETDIRHCIELWQREPDERDIPLIKDEHGNVIQYPVYYGKWADKTAWAKANWEVVLAENEMIRLQKEQIKRMRETTPDVIVHKMSIGAVRGTKLC